MSKDKLTICFFGNASSIHTIKWVNYFAGQGHNVHLFSYELPDSDEAPGVNLHIIKKIFNIELWPFNTIINFPFVLFKLKKAVREIRPDIIHAHYVTSYGHLAAFLNFHPLVVTAWGSDVLIAPRKSIKSKKIVEYVFKKADLITCDALHMKDAIKKLGAKESKIKVVNFGIDTKKFFPNQEAADDKRPFNIISLRNLEKIYDIETLIKAASIVLKKNSDAKFLIAGEGSEKEKLIKTVRDLNISASVEFIGRIKNIDLPKILANADIYVSTSLSDAGISSSTAEAMACGLAVVITNTGENGNWIEEGKSGYLIPIKNPEILAERITSLLKNKAKRSEFGSEARKVIIGRNDYYNEMKKMEKIYCALKNNN